MRIGRAVPPVFVLVLAALPMATQFQSNLAFFKKPAAAAAIARGFVQPFSLHPRPRWAAPQHVTLRAAPRVFGMQIASVSVQTYTKWAFGAGAPPQDMRLGLDRSQTLLQQELESRGLRQEWACRIPSDLHEALYVALANQTAMLSGKTLDAISLSQRTSEIRRLVKAFIAGQDEVLGVSASGGASSHPSHSLSAEMGAAASVLSVCISHFSVDHNALHETRFVPAKAPPPEEKSVVLVTIGPVMYSARPASANEKEKQAYQLKEAQQLKPEVVLPIDHKAILEERLHHALEQRTALKWCGAARNSLWPQSALPIEVASRPLHQDPSLLRMEPEQL
ncbi:hypothetical protein T484DRAFT_1890354, partial [Baffinella frigidus]